MMINIIAIAALLVVSGFFSACEMAFSSVNKIRLKNYANQGNKKARLALSIASKFDNALTAILIGNNVVNIASASIGTMLFTDLFGDKGVGIATIIMTIAVLIFGEILPKSVAKEHAEAVSLAVAGLLNICIIILTPFTWVFSHIRKLVGKVFKSSAASPSVTEDELKFIIEESEEQGVLEEQESDLVRSALEFDEIRIGEILRPRVNVVGVDVCQSTAEIQEIFLEEMYSRMPVFDKSIDNIVGIINQKDFFRMIVQGGASIKEIITDIIYISDLRPISEVLQEMQRRKIHMAVVLDQYGGTQGIVTLEDIIEELVGEIYDENDEVITMLYKISDNLYEISGELSINDMLEQLELPLESISSEVNSVGGWVMELLGRIPSIGDTITTGIFTLTVIKTDGQKLEKIKLSVAPLEDNSI